MDKVDIMKTVSMFSASVRLPSVEDLYSMDSDSHVDLPCDYEHVAVHASASGKTRGKHASGEDALDMSLSPPCTPPNVGRGSAVNTSVKADVLWAKQLGREARLRVDEDNRCHLRKG
tara:strand:+ start:327 stop:677 length:351 start_codon:yes stop_codon:yes gene_type:complete